MANIIDQLEAEQMNRDIPDFEPGDTVVVHVKVKEGERERVQAFEGVVIAKRNRGANSAFTVRKISYGEGVERVFQTYSHAIEKIEVKRRGDVRRAKLYYLRGRTGKSARIKEKISYAAKGDNQAVADEASIAEAAAEAKAQDAAEAKAAKNTSEQVETNDAEAIETEASETAETSETTNDK